MPFDVPEGWATIEDISQDVTDFVASGSFASLRENVKYYDGKEYAVLVRTKDFQNNFTKELVYTDKHGYEFLSNSNLYGGELILPNIGASIGKAFIVPHLGCPMTLAPNAIMIRFFNDTLKMYIYYLFLSSYGQSILESISSSTAQGKFNKTDLRTVLAPLPPLTQISAVIAEIKKLYSLIDVIEGCEAGLQTAVNQAKSKILDLALSGKLTSHTSHYQQLPDGWELKALEDVLDYEQPQKYIVDSTDYSDSYATPVLTAGKSFVIGHTNEVSGIFTNVPVIIFDDFTTDSKYVNFPFKVKSSAMKILHPRDGITLKYVAYFMSVTRLVGNTHKRYWISEYSKIMMPVPPKDEQDRIVSTIEQIYSLIDNILK